jgi:hypothetical protein
MVGNCECGQGDYTKHISILPNISAKKICPTFEGCSWAGQKLA